MPNLQRTSRRIDSGRSGGYEEGAAGREAVARGGDPADVEAACARALEERSGPGYATANPFREAASPDKKDKRVLIISGPLAGKVAVVCKSALRKGLLIKVYGIGTVNKPELGAVCVDALFVHVYLKPYLYFTGDIIEYN